MSPRVGELQLHADAAIESEGEDRLGRAPLAEQLTRAISRVPTSAGFVYGVQGPWGSGKTSLLNLLEKQLKQESQLPILVVRYDPWWFSGDEAILRHFLDHLGKSIGDSNFWKSESRKLGKAIQSLGRATAPAWELVAPGPAGKKIADVQRNLSAEKILDVFKLRERVTADLKRQNVRVVVMLDELDRLLPSELRTVFRLVKSVARFPNVIYVLAYSRDETIAALDEVVHGRGEAYLEKIVQTAIDLPAPQEHELRTLLTQDLDLLVRDTPEELWESHDWANLYLGGVRFLLRTPRDITRYVNMIAGTYPAIQTEVHGVDYFGLQALRVFAPSVYDTIQERPDLFTKPQKSDRAAVEAMLSGITPERRHEAVKSIVELLFPRVRGLVSNSTYGGDWDSTWRKGRRIASDDILPVYFRLSVPAGVLSREELASVLAAASRDREALTEELRRLMPLYTPSGTSRVILLLDWLEDHTSEIPRIDFEAVVTALVDLGDDIHRGQGPRGMLEPDADIRILRVIHQLLTRLPTQADRYEIYRRAFNRARSLYTPSHIVAVLGQEHGKRSSRPPGPESEREISPAQLGKLERLVLRKLRTAAADGSLIASPRPLALLWDWKEWAGVRSPRAYARKLVQDDRGIARLLEGALSQGASQTIGDHAARIEWHIQVEAFEPFVDVARLRPRVQQLLRNKPAWLTERQRLALETFEREITESDQTTQRHGRSPSEANLGPPSRDGRTSPPR